MKRHQECTFEAVELSQLLAKAQDCKDRGLAFVQLCATTLDESCEINYTFQNPAYGATALEGFIVNVPDGAQVPSITEMFPAAFVFENEAHDLFGIDIAGINIDFRGEFYTVAVAYPMNPRAAAQNDEPAQDDQEATDE